MINLLFLISFALFGFSLDLSKERQSKNIEDTRSSKGGSSLQLGGKLTVPQATEQNAAASLLLTFNLCEDKKQKVIRKPKKVFPIEIQKIYDSPIGCLADFSRLANSSILTEKTKKEMVSRIQKKFTYSDEDVARAKIDAIKLDKYWHNAQIDPALLKEFHIPKKPSMSVEADEVAK